MQPGSAWLVGGSVFTLINSNVTDGQRCCCRWLCDKSSRRWRKFFQPEMFPEYPWHALPFPAQKALKHSHPGVSKGVGLDSRHRCPCSDNVHGQCHWHHWFFGETTVNLDATKSHNITKLLGKGTHRSFASTQEEISLPALSTTSPPTSPSGSAAETSLQIKGFYAMMASWKAAQGCLPLPIPRSSSIPTQSPLRHTDLTNYLLPQTIHFPLCFPPPKSGVSGAAAPHPEAQRAEGGAERGMNRPHSEATNPVIPQKWNVPESKCTGL